MPFDKRKNTFREDIPHDLPTDFEPDTLADNHYRSAVLMRVMLVFVNLASLVLCRSFSRGWQEMHGSATVWIPIIFLLVPFGSLAFIYLFMGKLGSERIIKAVCIIFCALQAASIFYPPSVDVQIPIEKEQSAPVNLYVSQASETMGISFPDGGDSTSFNNSILKLENPERKLYDEVKDFFKGERVYSCTDVKYKKEQVKEFEASIKKSPVWLSEIPDSLSGLPVSSLDVSGYDCYLFFDRDEKKFNAVPKSGAHIFYQVMYNSQTHELRILKYKKTFKG